jgi:hypothetical protein
LGPPSLQEKEEGSDSKLGLEEGQFSVSNPGTVDLS